jgi:large subunit ribosomal protein L17
MRHSNSARRLNRTRRGRTALLRGLAISLIEHGKIATTEAKAKELRPYVERLVTYAKDGSLAARRRTASKLGEPDMAIVSKLFGEIAEGYKERPGGYTRITKMGRTAAGRDEAVIEFVK